MEQRFGTTTYRNLMGFAYCPQYNIVTGAYRKMSTIALCASIGIPPCHLRLFQTSASWKVSRLEAPVVEFSLEFYKGKFTNSSACPFKKFLHKANDIVEMEIKIYRDGTNIEEGTVSAFCAYEISILCHTFQPKLKIKIRYSRRKF